MGTTPLTNQVFFTDNIINSDDYDNQDGETRVAEIVAAISKLGYKGAGYTISKFPNGRIGYCYEFNLETPEGKIAQYAYCLFLAGQIPPVPEECLGAIKRAYIANGVDLPTPLNSSRGLK